MQAKSFTETRILQRAIKVRLLSAPVSLGNLQSGPTPAAASKSNGGLPPAPGGASFMIGIA